MGNIFERQHFSEYSKRKKKLQMFEFGFVKSDYFHAVFVMNMITAIPFLLWWPQTFPTSSHVPGVFLTLYPFHPNMIETGRE